MSENAPGQLLGFTIQYPRALCHLLRATPGCTVCIEVHGDVSTHYPGGNIVAEEDKSSINSNPITDKSTDLWKTLSNWVNSIKSGELDSNKTDFVLYRNRAGRPGLAEVFDQCQSDEEAKAALERAQEKLKDIKEDHPIWEYYSNAVLKNGNILINIIKNFRLETGEGAGYTDVEGGIRSKHVPTSQIRNLASSLNGWLVRLVADKIGAGQDARITWDEFDAEFRVSFDRARRLELIDFTIQSPPSSDEVDRHLKAHPTYVRQISVINGDEDQIIEAVVDYLRANLNMARWIEDDLIDEQVAADFEDRLKRFWSNAQKKINITNRNLNCEDRALLLLSECVVRSETIRGESPPASTIAGTYHALADAPKIGWHSDWEAMFKK